MSWKQQIVSGMNLSMAWEVARALGCLVRGKRRTGELVFSHPLVPRRVVINGRRKDSPRALTVFLRVVVRAMEGGHS